MTEVLSLKCYRKRKREEYLTRFGRHMEKCINSYIESHVDINYDHLSQIHCQQRLHHSYGHWDYLEFREEIQNEMEQKFFPDLYQILANQWWFDKRWLSECELKEAFFQFYINLSIFPSSDTG